MGEVIDKAMSGSVCALPVREPITTLGVGTETIDVRRDSANAWEPVASTTAPTAHHAAYRITAGQAACHQSLWLGPSIAFILMSLASQHKPNIDLSSRSDYSASTGAVRG